jgi:hypothetical protein
VAAIFALWGQGAYVKFYITASAGLVTMPTISACRLDLLVDDEAKLIGFSAAVLQISEYELFRIAYRQWFNRPITESSLDSLFKAYLATGESPYWVNDFARKVHDKFKAGTLDYRDYGIKRRVCDRRTRIKGWLITVFLLLLLVLYSYLIAGYQPY